MDLDWNWKVVRGCKILENAEYQTSNKQFCKICQTKVEGKHDCVHAKPTEAARNRQLKKQEAWTMVLYDCESIVTSSGSYKGASSLGDNHIPNVLVYKVICNECMGSHCDICGEMCVFSYNLREGESGTVIERFIQFLKKNKNIKNTYVIAHNGGRYDHVFTLEDLVKDEEFQPNLIMSGNTFITADVPIATDNTIHFRDSVRYMPMALDQLPGAFELKTKSKGYFPYMFNHPDNYGKILDGLPPIEYYEPNLMNIKKREDFETWYFQNKENPFNLDMEIVEYCKNDVQILVEAVVEFIKICKDTFAGWNPIIQATTLPSFVLFVIKYEHLESGVIGYIPENGYGGRNNSKFALKYLLWLEHNNPGMKITHKLSKGGEFHADCGSEGFHVDGYNVAENLIYEIHGCIWHGCKKCYPDQEVQSPINKHKKMWELYEETMKKDKTLLAAGYNMCVKWECEIRKEMVKNKEMALFFKNCRYDQHLRPREAMFGGRTQQFQSLVKACPEFSIEYFDFCSLYPYINIKGAEYPIGVPQRLVDGFESITPGPLPYKGIVFCDVLPPTNLALPVLPYRANGKLLFPLCRTCAVSKKYTECTHILVSERLLTGVWCTDELNLAIEEGYKILRYHEVWHWSKWFRGGFFAKFMLPLLKMKHEASGVPRPDMTDTEIDDFIREIFDNEGVMLDKEKINKNPALRSTCKLFLNCSWGKLAQNPWKTETKLFPMSQALDSELFINAPGVKPKCFKEWKESHILVSRKPAQETVETTPFTNIAYGALTTSAARVKLYSAMKMVGAENMIYCDTDSLMFRQKRGENVLGPLRGNGLGQLTDETPSGWLIDEVVALAPKVYSLKMVDMKGNERCVSKAKGFTLNSETQHKINFEAMKELMINTLAGGKQNITVRRIRMKRGSNILDGITSEIEMKRLQPIMDKGKSNEHGVLEPFGTIKKDVVITDDCDFDV